MTCGVYFKVTLFASGGLKNDPVLGELRHGGGLAFLVAEDARRKHVRVSGPA